MRASSLPVPASELPFVFACDLPWSVRFARRFTAGDQAQVGLTRHKCCDSHKGKSPKTPSTPRQVGQRHDRVLAGPVTFARSSTLSLDLSHRAGRPLPHCLALCALEAISFDCLTVAGSNVKPFVPVNSAINIRCCALNSRLCVCGEHLCEHFLSFKVWVAINQYGSHISTFSWRPRQHTSSHRAQRVNWLGQAAPRKDNVKDMATMECPLQRSSNERIKGGPLAPARFVATECPVLV